MNELMFCINCPVIVQGVTVARLCLQDSRPHHELSSKDKLVVEELCGSIADLIQQQLHQCGELEEEVTNLYGNIIQLIKGPLQTLTNRYHVLQCKLKGLHLHDTRYHQILADILQEFQDDVQESIADIDKVLHMVQRIYDIQSGNQCKQQLCPATNTELPTTSMKAFTMSSLKQSILSYLPKYPTKYSTVQTKPSSSSSKKHSTVMFQIHLHHDELMIMDEYEEFRSLEQLLRPSQNHAMYFSHPDLIELTLQSIFSSKAMLYGSFDIVIGIAEVMSRCGSGTRNMLWVQGTCASPVDGIEKAEVYHSLQDIFRHVQGSFSIDTHTMSNNEIIFALKIPIQSMIPLPRCIGINNKETPSSPCLMTCKEVVKGEEECTLKIVPMVINNQLPRQCTHTVHTSFKDTTTLSFGWFSLPGLLTSFSKLFRGYTTKKKASRYDVLPIHSVSSQEDDGSSDNNSGLMLLESRLNKPPSLKHPPPSSSSSPSPATPSSMVDMMITAQSSVKSTRSFSPPRITTTTTSTTTTTTSTATTSSTTRTAATFSSKVSTLIRFRAPTATALAAVSSSPSSSSSSSSYSLLLSSQKKKLVNVKKVYVE